ncbi:hypothetical protein [Sulfitobacter sp. R18_1]|uniref:hypothetical protein n=1 Tax=Sulfitobacter sp. R18_1 TaxID=2821104 RepID=UPI001ADCECA0|nr:hypothetical protein [Sulfitobacter sp. R18_1]MBO9428245.1 hypothetical protein [Sulfitobacter sp. R18_1]
MSKNLSHPSPIGAATNSIEKLANIFRGIHIDKFNGNTDILIRELGGKVKDDLRGDLIWSVDDGQFYFPQFTHLSIRAREKQYATIIGLQVLHSPSFREERPGVIMRVNSSEPSLKSVIKEAMIFGNELVLPHKYVLQLYDQGGCDAVRYELKTGFLSAEEIKGRVEYARQKVARAETPSPAP